ncbi:kinesin related protein 1 [Metarhizium acridum CQMa 102]|uniref:Kinesin-like protein n=1 Tax=Metarhizium acridum (strain CQMa 102) TaxID=655827 RepID=E9DWK2_METAQ|nr:kinesin related protein 1 [Metarhizium acridum CQMa 102]EFY92052.1 kinesin related protein 1 [Metarhizium acridum CQMa 102]
METSDIQPLRASKISRLPGPAVHAGLAELSESQHNARAQTAIPAPPGFKPHLKREIPQPGTNFATGELLGQFPGLINTIVSKGGGAVMRTIIRKSDNSTQLKRPTRHTTNTAAPTSLTSFAKSFGPARHQTDRSNPAAFRSSHARSKSQAARPRTAHGHRPEEHFEDTTSTNAWDVDGRVDSMESQFRELKDMVNTTLVERKGHEDALELAKTRVVLNRAAVVSELEEHRQRLEERNEALKTDLDAARDENRQAKYELERLQWQQKRDVEDLNRRHRDTIDDLSRQHRTAIEDLSKELDQLKDEETKEHQARIDALNRHYQQELEDERQKKDREIQDLRARMGNEQQDLNLELQRKDREIRDARLECDSLRDDLEREKSLKGSLQTNITELSAANTTLEAKINSLRSHVEFLESDSKAQSDSFASMEARLQEALAAAEEARRKLIKEETERRVLFNKYQELKGNIRVMCRVRPAITDDASAEAGISFPDEKTSAEIVLAGPEEKSSLGVVSRKNYPFEFDRVFAPAVQNEEIFGEISQLVQSALDGYNVCIFCYGQTGSGKTYTMSSEDGMIPRATHMIYDTMTKLKEKSWEYTMEGSFVEVYNEELNDLLTPNDRSADARSRKLEIRHDEARKQTTIVNCKTVQLNSASSVERILDEAQKNRSVAATKANERSSRSHSVFILKLVGENVATGERCEGTLNLVDLAGSERLKHSQAEGDRMKETQNINKSLSCLGDVIEALGRGSGHIPYRNSKLTHLLQYSLGGNSKTLMFVMVSPLETHLKETLTSLRFATKVHNTHIGTAKATKKIRGSE